MATSLSTSPLPKLQPWQSQDWRLGGQFQLIMVIPDLHTHLAAWRESKGYSQEQVANILSVNKSTVHRWEKGLRTVDLADLSRLAAVYGVDPIALLLAPGEVQLARDLTAAKSILESRDPAATKTWLEMGALLPQTTK